MSLSHISLENISSVRRISFVALSVKCRKRLNTGMAAVECDPPSSRKCFYSSFSPKRLKTSESSSENLKLGENAGDEQTEREKTAKRERESGQAETKCIRKEKTDIDSDLEFPSHSQDELRKIYGERTQRKLTFDSEELESSEEEEGVSQEELEKTKGWKLLMDALDSKFEKKEQAKP